MAIIIDAPDQFVVQNYLAQPLGGDKFLISLSGVALADFTGQSGSEWHRDEADLYLSLEDALVATGRTPRPGFHLEFALQQWTSLVTPNAFTDLHEAVNFGVAVDTFQVDWRQGTPQLSVRVVVNLAARDIDTFLHRLGYMMILIGDVVEVETVPIP